MQNITIAVGTTSKHKLSAVTRACEQFGMTDISVVGCETDSHVNAQPIDPNESVTGAWNRADQARAAYPNAAFWIGIESGVFLARQHKIFLDLAVIVVLMKDGTFVAATSPGIIFDEESVAEAETLGFETTTVGSIIAKKYACDPTDPHTALTEGKLKRADTLVQGIIAAFSQSRFAP
jgi:non-canonical (house-cleaning) NTP pyrophosphatase